MTELWAPLSGLLVIMISIVAAAHVLLYKRDVRATIGWVGVIWLVPIIGALLYVLLGINRIRRRAQAIRGPARARPGPNTQAIAASVGVAHLQALATLSERATEIPATEGNSVRLLAGGDTIFGEMLAAIDHAERSIMLTTYIFDADRIGRRFVRALVEARKRGVEVRVLVDALGARYYNPPIYRVLKDVGIRCAVFMPTRWPWRLPYANLRTHRKVLVIDGWLAFTGGCNIREGCMTQLDPPPAHTFEDLHARVEGPVVGQLQHYVASDWTFAAREELSGDLWFPELTPQGSVIARSVPDGPDRDFEKLRMVLLGALTAAVERVRIVTPYFLPDQGLITALTLAALRGVRVDIVVPKKNNLRLIQWASVPILTELVERGCRVWETPPPFDHSKLMVVDDAWTLLGSGNWDPRSLRLNFELNVECYDRDLAHRAADIADERIACATELTPARALSRPLPLRLRDGLARLLTPYL